MFCPVIADSKNALRRSSAGMAADGRLLSLALTMNAPQQLITSTCCRAIGRKRSWRKPAGREARRRLTKAADTGFLH
jgi:hypothetical protein